MNRIDLIVTAVAVAISSASHAAPAEQRNPPTTHVALGWNDLGMHCMNRYYGDLCVLPPFNNLWVQVVQRGTPPQLTTQGIELTYRFPDNTYSAGKVNFWDYEHLLFGANLPNNVGLTGHGLTGILDWNGSAFEATGVPLTPWDDANLVTEQPYQFAEVTLKSISTSATLDQTVFVAPTSTEMACGQCHHEDGMTVEYVILTKHDEGNGTNLRGSRPVLCANCHASNALGMPGVAGVPSLSRAVHAKHAQEEGPLMPCYSCHPGPQTQCQRGAMYLAGKACADCHGNIQQVADSISAGRRPWIDEPRCTPCHDANHAENAGKLYRQSTGHGGLYCIACHNSPHAELPTAQPRDSVQSMRVQGTTSFIRDCTVCHTTMPTAPGPHGYLPPSTVKNWKQFD